MLSPRRLPGIQMDVAPPPAVEALPRMDVAVFVGFASTGPLHLPVAIESSAQYATVFGADAPLAWDAQRGERVQALLGPTVRAFFANGGQRCWVVRVARNAALEEAAGRTVQPDAVLATSSRFALPGVLVVAPDEDASTPLPGPAQAAVVAARCEGSWADALRVDTALQQRGLALQAWTALDSPARHFSFQTRDALRSGELLQLGDDASTCAYASVQTVATGPLSADLLQATLAVCAAFARVGGLGVPSLNVGTAQVQGYTDGAAANWLPATVPAANTSNPRHTLQFDALVPATLETGHWLRWQDSAQVLWLRMDEISRTPADSSASPAVDGALMQATVSGPCWRELGPVLPATLGVPTRARVLSLELRAFLPAGPVQRLAPLALTPQRTGNFWEQQTDAAFYQPRQQLQAVHLSEQPRFALAPATDTPPLAWLPLGVQPGFGPGLPALPQAGTALERDGLAAFDSDLFIDPALAGDSLHGLLAHAESLRLINPPTRALFGMHAALGVGEGGLFNEPSLLSLPDAIHLGWQARSAVDLAPAPADTLATPAHWRAHRGPCMTAPSDAAALDAPDFGVFLDADVRKLPTPQLSGPAGALPSGTYRLRWTASEPGARYTLWEATSADFSDARILFQGESTQYLAFTQREGRYFYRVLASSGTESSAPSNSVAVTVRSVDWLQNESDADDMEPHWLVVHRAALRLAAASGDWLAVLSMPRHFRSAQALRYAQRLRSVQHPRAEWDTQALAASEARALSYGALYFPWLQADAGTAGSAGIAGNAAAAGTPAATGRTATHSPLVVPPDGVAVGVLAARSLRRGAWVAAANEPMKDVVALSPPVPERERQALQDAQINLLRADPRGFFTLSADTLATEDALRPINVRRLLMLLRRLALQRGTRYVFEPHGAALRRAVQRGFDGLLTDLFNRGAFAGATPEQSFRVVTDDTVNTPQGMDAGQLVVELRVAPSRPLRFMAVRLAQRGERLSLVEEL